MEGMVERLHGQGVEVEMQAVLDEAGPRRTMIGRPHLARAMVEAGYVSTVNEAFDRFIGDGHPAFLPTRLADPVDAIGVIGDAGGIPVWAHPPADLIDDLLPELVRAGLRGMEVYRPGSRPDQIRRLEGVTRTAGLLRSGGSDWHDVERNRPLGEFFVTRDEVSALLDAGGL
jgi:predicted metal-dependent phosphoesterase TrpH